MNADSRLTAGIPPRDGDPSGTIGRVSRAVSTVTSRPAPAPDEELDEAGIDSLARLELLAVLEIEFDVEISEDLLIEFRTINKIVRIVEGILELSARNRGRDPLPPSVS